MDLVEIEVALAGSDKGDRAISLIPLNSNGGIRGESFLASSDAPTDLDRYLLGDLGLAPRLVTLVSTGGGDGFRRDFGDVDVAGLICSGENRCRRTGDGVEEGGGCGNGPDGAGF